MRSITIKMMKTIMMMYFVMNIDVAITFITIAATTITIAVIITIVTIITVVIVVVVIATAVIIIVTTKYSFVSLVKDPSVSYYFICTKVGIGENCYPFHH